ncbi:MAG TPA: TetR/AcrR family transcriptional regulator [Acidimicrobiales bacterium]|nr:TetR/AcrR family transcriptional regulator [Acidimicrobiales bacterium]
MEPARAEQAEVRRSRLDPAARRAQIVAAAAEVFRGRDPATVRFDEVAAAAGVSRSLVYAYFGDRGELIAAVYLHSLAGVDEELSRLVQNAPVDKAQLASLVRHFLELAQANADSWRVFAAAGAVDHPAVQRARRERCQRIADTWGGSASARMLARGLVGLLEAATSEWIEHAPCSIDDAVGLITWALWDGVGRFPRPGLPA